MYLRQRRCVRHFAFVLLCVLPAPAALAQSVDIPLQLVQSTLGAQLLINIGIDGGASRPYLFDTGSSVFNAFYSPQAFGNVPSQQAGLPTEVLYQYTSGETYYGNLVETPSLTFYANSTSGTGVATLNATTPSGAQSSFLINALYGRLPTSQTTDANGNFLPNPPPPDAIPVPIGELNGSASGNSPGFYGIFGAGDFTSVVKGFSSNTTAVVGGVLGQASIPGTIAGYVVAANGTPLNSLMSNAGLNPGATINGPQVGQNVTSCSPCVMLGLTPALLAQFKSINTLHWTGTTDPFPLSGASASTHFGIDFNYTLTNASGQTRHARGVPTLLDTGTVHYIFNKFGTNQNPPNDETITFSGAKNGSTQTTNVINPDGSSNFRYDSPYRAVFNGAVNGSTLGIGFFLQNSVLYNLQGEVVGYTPNFVTDTNIVTTSSSPLTIGSNSVPLGLAGIISGAGGVTITNGGSATLSGTSTYTGMTTITGGMLALAGPGSIGASRGVSVSSGGLFDISQVSGGTIIQSLSGDANGMVNLGQQMLVLSNANGAYAGAITGGGGLILTGGTQVLTGTEAYSGATTIDGGTLEVDGVITNTASVAVNAGGVLSGSGIVDPPAVTIGPGGTLMPGSLAKPGSSLTIDGNLIFEPGSNYVVGLGAAGNDTIVTGTASLAGAIAPVLVPSNGVKKEYTVLQSAGLNGTRFDSLQTIDLPNFIADVGYSSTDVTLDLTAAMPTSSLPRNLRGLAGLLNNSFNSNGVLPAGPAALYGATGEALNNALSQATGESATGAEESAFQLTNEFLSLLLDPFVDGRDSTSGTADSGNETPALAYAAAPNPSSAEMALANIKGPAFAPIYVPRWNAWASGFGGTSWTGGTAAIGTHSVSAQTYGSAAGVDYHATPDTFIGFALAGAGLGWNLTDGLGGGNGTSLQAGVYGATQRGPVYVAGAASFAEHWLATKRDSFTGDQLTANFGAQSYGGRLEAGYRIPASFIAAGRFTVSPYAAIQAQDFHTPSYGETDSASGGFGLSYAGADAVDTRSELGARFDTYSRLDNGMGLDLRARAAWAHDWVGTPTLDAAFEVLPGGSFIVNGATPPHNSALLSTGAELHVTPTLSVLIKFDGAVADTSDTYAGTATLRYAW